MTSVISCDCDFIATDAMDMTIALTARAAHHAPLAVCYHCTDAASYPDCLNQQVTCSHKFECLVIRDQTNPRAQCVHENYCHHRPTDAVCCVDGSCLTYLRLLVTTAKPQQGTPQSTPSTTQGQFSTSQSTPNAAQGIFSTPQSTPSTTQGLFRPTQSTSSAAQGIFSTIQSTASTAQGLFSSTQAPSSTTYGTRLGSFLDNGVCKDQLSSSGCTVQANDTCKTADSVSKCPESCGLCADVRRRANGTLMYCEDQLIENKCHDLQISRNICRDAVAKYTCPKTCGFCHDILNDLIAQAMQRHMTIGMTSPTTTQASLQATSTLPSCADNLHGLDCSSLSGVCNNILATTICKQYCGFCGSGPVTVRPLIIG